MAVVDLADLLCGPGGMRKVGRTWTARCPLPDHEDRSPSFVVYPDNHWFCYGCLRGGDVLELARLAWGYEKREVVRSAVSVLRTFDHDVPKLPQRLKDKIDRQHPVRQAIADVRLEHLRRRLFRAFFKDAVAAIEDPAEREAEFRILWEATEPFARHMRDEVERRRGSPR